MKSVLIAAAAVIGFAGAALAEGPQLLTDDQMDKVVAGARTDTDTLIVPAPAAAAAPGLINDPPVISARPTSQLGEHSAVFCTAPCL